MVVQELDKESKDLVIGLGLIAIARSGPSEDWYVFANLKSGDDADRKRIASALSQCGTVSNYSFDQVFNHADRFFCASGFYENIMQGLDILAERDKKLSREIARIRATFDAEPDAAQ
jgi:hypothetical protein